MPRTPKRGQVIVYFFAFAYLLAALTGCSPKEGKLDGSIFIVTEGAQNIKLGLVTVSLLDNEQVKTAITNTAVEIWEVWPQETARACFARLPSPIMTAKSDADGKFFLAIPRKGQYVLAAKAQREVLKKTEEYFWLVPVSLDGKANGQVMLSNDNLITTKSVEAVFRNLVH